MWLSKILKRKKNRRRTEDYPQNPEPSNQHDGITHLSSSSASASPPRPSSDSLSLHGQTLNTALRSDPATSALRHDNLWLEAHDQLSADDRVIVGGFVPQDKGALQFNTNDMVQELKNKGETCKAGNWRFRVGNHTVSFQDAVNKTLYWIEKVKAPIDIAVSADPVHAALPWAGIRFLISMVEANRNQIESLLSGISHICYITRRCQLYEALMNDLSLPKNDLSMRARQGLRSALIDFYILILHFLAQAARVYQLGSSRRAITAIWSSGDIGEFELQCEKLERRAETEAQVFERFQSNHMLRLSKELLDVKIQNDDVGHVGVTAIWDYLQGKERGEILRWVSEIDTLEQHRVTKYKRTAGTGEWVLRHQEFQSWQSSDEPTILWLHGIPGAGKSVLVSRVIDHLENDHPDTTLAYFYCDRGYQERRNLGNILRSYIKQLSMSRRVDAIPHSIIKRYKEIHHSGSSTRLSVEESKTLLLELINSSRNPVLILDALDEADVEDREEILTSFDLLMVECCDLKIFISSRRNEDIKRRLQNKGNLGIEASDNQGDIETFIHAQLERMARVSHPNLSQALKDDIVKSLLGRNEGMFQWVTLLIGSLPQIPEDIPDWLKQLPRGLPEVYKRIFAEIQAQGGSEPKIARAAFEWMIGSYQTLDQGTLVDLVRQSLEYDGRKYPSLTIDMVLGACRNLLVVDNSTRCHFPHLSVREFLEDPTHASEEFFIDHLHYRLALANLSYLLEANDSLLLWGETDEAKWYNFIESQSQGRIYAAIFWPSHAKLAFSEESSSVVQNSVRLERLIERFFSPSFLCAYKNWLLIYDCDQETYFDVSDKENCSEYGAATYLSHLPGKLYYASLFDFDFLVEALISQRTEVAAKGKYENAIVAAGARSSLKALRQLLRASGTIRVEDAVSIMREIESRFLETSSLLVEFSVQFQDQVPVSTDGSSPEKPPSTASLLTAMALGAAQNQRVGHQALESLLDARDPIFITHDVLYAIVENEDIGDKVLLTLYKKCKPGISITETVLQRAAKNMGCGEKLMAILLDQPGSEISMTETVLQRAAENSGCGDKLMAILLHQPGSEILITETVLQMAAENSGCGGKLMAILLAQPSGMLITETVLQRAAKNSRCGDKLMAMLLHQPGSEILITETVLQMAAENSRYGDRLMALLLDQPGSEMSITETVLQRAAENNGCGDKLIARLLRRPGSRVLITETVLQRAAKNSRCGDKLMAMLLHQPGSEMLITETVLQMAAENSGCGGKLMAILLAQPSGMLIAQTVLRRAAGNKNCGSKLMAILLDQPGSDKHSNTESHKMDSVFNTKVLDAIFEGKSERRRAEIMEKLFDCKFGDVLITEERMNSSNSQSVVAVLFHGLSRLLVSEDFLCPIAKCLNIIRRLSYPQRAEATAEDVLILAAINEFGANTPIIVALEDNEATLQVQEDLITIVDKGSQRGDYMHKPLVADLGTNFAFPDDAPLFAIKGGDRGYKLWGMLVKFRAFSARMKRFLDIDGGVSGALSEDIWSHLNLEQRQDIFECLIEYQISVTFTENLIRDLNSLHFRKYGRIQKLSRYAHHITEGAFIERFRDPRASEILPLITRKTIKLPFTENLIKAAAEVKHGDSLIIFFIRTRGSELKVTESVVIQISRLLKASVMETLLQKCSDVPITHAVFEAAKENTQEPREMEKVLKERRQTAML